MVHDTVRFIALIVIAVYRNIFVQQYIMKSNLCHAYIYCISFMIIKYVIFFRQLVENLFEDVSASDWNYKIAQVHKTFHYSHFVHYLLIAPYGWINCPTIAI